MKTTRIALFTLWMVFISLTLATAQDRGPMDGPQGPLPPPSPQQVDEMIDQLTTELTLGEEQAEAFSSAFKKHMKAVREVREDARKQEREQMEPLKISFEKELESILTETQLKKFHEIHPPRKEGPGGKPGRKAPDRREHAR